jgi:hypothetical protein
MSLSVISTSFDLDLDLRLLNRENMAASSLFDRSVLFNGDALSHYHLHRFAKHEYIIN